MVNCLSELFKNQGQWIQVYTGVEVSQDPFEENVITTLNSSLSIKALVTDLTATQARWKMPGINLNKAKTIYVSKKYRQLIEASQKIEIRNSDKVTKAYEGWRENGRMQYREEGEYLEVYIYSKHT